MPRSSERRQHGSLALVGVVGSMLARIEPCRVLHLVGHRVLQKGETETTVMADWGYRRKLLWEAFGFLVDDICRALHVIRVPLFFIWGVSLVIAAGMTCSLVHLYFQGNDSLPIWALVFPGYVGAHILALILWWFKCCINRAKARLQ